MHNTVYASDRTSDQHFEQLAASLHPFMDQTAHRRKQQRELQGLWKGVAKTIEETPGSWHAARPASSARLLMFMP